MAYLATAEMKYSGPATLPPEQSNKRSSRLSECLERNAKNMVRLAEVLARLTDTKTRVLGSYPEKAEKTEGLRPDSHCALGSLWEQIETTSQLAEKLEKVADEMTGI